MASRWRICDWDQANTTRVIRDARCSPGLRKDGEECGLKMMPASRLGGLPGK